MNLLELVRQTGINPKWVASTGGGEYHSSCPACGGNDRFYLQPHRQMSKCLGSFCCRQCGIKGDAIQFAMQFLGCTFKEAATATNAVLSEWAYLRIYNLNHTSSTTTLRMPSEEWIKKATEFVVQAHEKLLQDRRTLAYLATRGLPLSAVIRYKLGWSNKDQCFSRTLWGLDEQVKEDGKQRIVWIPKGLIIPCIEVSGKVVRLKVRRFDWKEEDELPKYVAISGSMNGLSLIGSSEREIMVVVESELDAYAIDYAAHDLACAIAVGSNIKNPDNVVDRLAKNIKHLLICHDNDEAGKKMLIKWQRLYPHAIGCPTPFGKDIGEAIQNGLNIREWLLNRTNECSQIVKAQ